MDTTNESATMPISLITLGAKRSGERSAGNPHATFEAAGTGNGSIHRGHEYRVTRKVTWVALDTAPVLDPTRVQTKAGAFGGIKPTREKVRTL
jgi:hypothetical protein